MFWPISNVRNFCQNKNSLELLNIIFENSSPKGSFGANKKKMNFCFCRRIRENYWQPLLNLRKEENLSFDNILFVNDSNVIKKISFFDLTTYSQSGRGEVGMFILSIHCMKKSPTSKNMILRKGKNPWKVNLNGILNDWNRFLLNCKTFVWR